MSKEKTLVKEQVQEPVQPKVIWKGSQTFRHDLFKLGLAVMKKNLSFKKLLPELIPVEHVHVYHSHDTNGREQTTCAPVGGHFHNVKIVVDPKTGELKGECGPAVRKVVKKLASGRMKTVIEPIRFLTDDTDDLGNRVVVADDHTHPVQYLGSEEISSEIIKMHRQQNSDGLAKLGYGQEARQVQAQAQATQPEQASDYFEE